MNYDTTQKKERTEMGKIREMLWSINMALGYDTIPYSEEKNGNSESWGEFVMMPNVGTFFVTKEEEIGYSLNQIERGGSREIIKTSTRKELESVLIGMEKGVHAFEYKLR